MLERREGNSALLAGAATKENSMEAPPKIKNWRIIWSSNSIQGIYPKQAVLSFEKLPDVHCSITMTKTFKNGRQPECTRGRMDKDFCHYKYIFIMYVHTYINYHIYFLPAYHKNKWNSVILEQRALDHENITLKWSKSDKKDKGHMIL